MLSIHNDTTMIYIYYLDSKAKRTVFFFISN